MATQQSAAHVQCYAPDLEKRCRPHLKATTNSWRVDEMYVKVTKEHGDTSIERLTLQGHLEFQLSVTRDILAGKRLLQGTGAAHTVAPRIITVDKNAAYPQALSELKNSERYSSGCDLRQVTYLSHVVERDRRFIKRLVKPGLGFFVFEAAWRTLQGDTCDAPDPQGAGERGGQRSKFTPDQVHC